MSQGDKYVKLVEWSDEDRCFIGSCPELFCGGCHGPDAKAVFSELCEVIEDTIEIYKRDGKPLPAARVVGQQVDRVSGEPYER